MNTQSNYLNLYPSPLTRRLSQNKNIRPISPPANPAPYRPPMPASLVKYVNESKAALSKPATPRPVPKPIVPNKPLLVPASPRPAPLPVFKPASPRPAPLPAFKPASPRPAPLSPALKPAISPRPAPLSPALKPAISPRPTPLKPAISPRPTPLKPAISPAFKPVTPNKLQVLQPRAVPQVNRIVPAKVGAPLTNFPVPVGSKYSSDGNKRSLGSSLGDLSIIDAVIEEDTDKVSDLIDNPNVDGSDLTEAFVQAIELENEEIALLLLNSDRNILSDKNRDTLSNYIEGENYKSVMSFINRYKNDMFE